MLEIEVSLDTSEKENELEGEILKLPTCGNIII